MGQKRKVKKTAIKGNSAKPRLSVFRSNTNIYAQVIDDESGVTIAAASSLGKEKSATLAAATEVGKALGKAVKAKKLSKVVFDRGRYVYKGRVKALAEGAREAGLEF